jgi:hypothetical protein
MKTDSRGHNLSNHDLTSKLVASLLLVTAFGCMPQNDAHRIHATRVEMNHLAQVICLHVIANHRLPFSSNTNELMAVTLYRNLSKTNTSGSRSDLLELVPSSVLTRYASNQCLVDVWSTPFVFRVFKTNSATATVTNILMMQIWSCGRNRINESGLGDDLVSEPFAVLLPGFREKGFELPESSTFQ